MGNSCCVEREKMPQLSRKKNDSQVVIMDMTMELESKNKHIAELESELCTFKPQK